MSASTKKVSSQLVVYSILWISFLMMQLTLFAPIQPDPAFDQQFSDGVSGILPKKSEQLEANTWQESRTKPYFQQQRVDRPTGDAIFNNIDVYYKGNAQQDLFQSDFDCIGRNVKDPVVNANYSWMFRSCHFHKLCLNTESNELLLVAPSNGVGDVSQDLALGAVNPRWSGRGFDKGFHKVKWYPRQVDSETIKGYYELPSNVVMVPFHSMAAHNVGHLLWDDFYPLFTLLNLFGYAPKKGNNFQYLLLRWSSEKLLYATCERQKKKAKICNDNFQRFLPFLGVDPRTFSTVKKAELKVNPKSSQEQQLKSPYVCAKQAVAGIGMLGDHHGISHEDHGWVLRDPASGQDLVPHNVGRGGIFHEFRNFIVRNMGFPSSVPPRTLRNKITFSTHSSRFERDVGFESQSAAAQRALVESHQHNPNKSHNQQRVQVQSITMKDLSLEEQIQVALESVIFVTVCGGGAMTATFLPPGSTLIVYYLEDGGTDFWKVNYTYTPARLDWDLLANAAHLKVHWLPMKLMESQGDLKILEQLILHDLEAMNLL